MRGPDVADRGYLWWPPPRGTVGLICTSTSERRGRGRTRVVS